MRGSEGKQNILLADCAEVDEGTAAGTQALYLGRANDQPAGAALLHVGVLGHHDLEHAVQKL